MFSPHFSPTICTRESDAFQVRRHRPVRKGFIRGQRRSKTSWILPDSLCQLSFQGPYVCLDDDGDELRESHTFPAQPHPGHGSRRPAEDILIDSLRRISFPLTALLSRLPNWLGSGGESYLQCTFDYVKRWPQGMQDSYPLSLPYPRSFPPTVLRACIALTNCTPCRLSRLRYCGDTESLQVV
ncbi:hypothetical protein BDV37DRAFT_174255 [Aspergillus pseudonomiae]|uniref:Uncharacterized protein n=1 Tax=Aspergillus pseudonomiae TaxID=1506151 RepID=A0A5N7D5K0_9EURO|nr:uncharacterized protein BDV37DRAFT_174255 [Aspergillus pseudonomiae]KAE8401675.1 hypothetical protein BDV37DRAFT_174255 [Aspergillus pseudonomiae]